MDALWFIWLRRIIVAAMIVILGEGVSSTDNNTTVPEVHMCASQIYCQGDILKEVNRLRVYNDSKHFVDMPLKKSQAETLTAFKSRFPETERAKMTRDQLHGFLEEYFHEPGGELANCKPHDWTPEPDSFNGIKDLNYRQWAKDLQEIWLQLCRQMNRSVLDDFERNSLIYVPNIFIAPGGRFREFYYWDTYWIVKGLIVSKMYETIKSIIRNFAYVIGKIGFIPNGGRIYYLQRSQPPFFIPMVYEYYLETKDLEFVREVMPAMEAELQFWGKNRTIVLPFKGTNYTVFHYLTQSNTPRPESYKEDLALGERLKDASKRPELYQHIATAAETGLDFGSRYFEDVHDMMTIRTGDIVGVDVNALLCWNYKIMHLFHNDLGHLKESNDFREKQVDLEKVLDAVFYNNTVGSWLDVDLKTKLHIVRFYPSNAIPLFTGCYDRADTWKPKRLYEYLQKSGALSYPSGIPSSTVDTDQQWDLPNGWPPHNHMIIEGLRKSDDEAMQHDAFELADRWLRVNYQVYKRTKHMYEKYNVSDTSYQPGGGGEYEVQVGFGWTNGVVLDLLRTYGDRLVAPDSPAASVHCYVPSVWFVASCLLAIKLINVQ